MTAPTLDATPKGTASNSYCTVAEADDYFNTRIGTGTTWSAAGDDQPRSLIEATRLLDAFFEWRGYIRTTTQALRWPRSGLGTRDGINIDYDTIPSFLREATAELAFFLLTADRLAEPELLGKGFKSASVGSLDVEVDPGQVLEYVPRHVVALLEPYGALSAGAHRTGGRTVRVLRT